VRRASWRRFPFGFRSTPEWTYDEGGWIALCFEDVQGRHPHEPWTSKTSVLVVDALRRHDARLTAVQARRLRVGRLADRLDEDPTVILEADSRGKSGRKAGRLRDRFDDARTKPVLERRAHSAGRSPQSTRSPFAGGLEKDNLSAA